MDSFRFHDIRAEKASYRRVQRLTTLFRFVELLVFLILLSRFFSSQFAFSFKLSADYFRGISVMTLISPRSVFVIGNAIVVVLFFISGQFSGKKGEKTTDVYDQYVEKCRNNQNITWNKEVKRESDACKYSVRYDEKVLRRAHSSLEKTVQGEERRRDLRRSMSETCRKSLVKAAPGGGAAKVEDEMSSEEFRRTVEAFIARQQRCLREEEEFSAPVVS